MTINSKKLNENISKNISIEKEQVPTTVEETPGTTKLIVTKVSNKKPTRKKFQMEMDPHLYKELEKAKNMTGRSIVELVNIMVKFGLDNLEVK